MDAVRADNVSTVEVSGQSITYETRDDPPLAGPRGREATRVVNAVGGANALTPRREPPPERAAGAVMKLNEVAAFLDDD